MRKIILFDLDGTILESGEGIIKSLQYAIQKMELPERTAESLRVFIGPPLLEQMMATFELSQNEAEKMVKFYQKRYATTGMFESKPYDGVENLLKKLHKENYVLAVASSKPEKFVNLMLENFKLNHYFTESVGHDVENGRDTKALVIKEALKRLDYSREKDKIIMVGDKEHDVLGAREEGIECISVLYGYGTKEELQEANPLKIVATVSELQEELLQF